MNRIMIPLRAILLVMLCVSCVSPEVTPVARTASALTPSQPTPSVLPVPVFRTAIAVRDDLTTVLFGWLNTGRSAPSTLAITFYDAVGNELGTLPSLNVQVLKSGLVYAAPSLPPFGIQQDVKDAVGAEVMVESVVQSIYLGQASGTISQFFSGDWGPWVGYGGCPHCVTYFLCHCLEKLYGVPLKQEVSACPPLDQQSTCEAVEKLVPRPL